MPFVPGEDGLCGPSVLAMLLSHAGQPVTASALEASVYLPGRQGSLQVEMLAAVRRHARPAVTLSGGWAELAAELSAGRPVGALVNLSLPLWPRWHYLVVTAIDPSRGDVRVHSGMQADAIWSTATFESVWARSGRWAFVVLPPGALPVQAGEAATLQGLLALDRAAPAGAAAPWWMAATTRWPRSLTAAVGAAQSLAAGGDGAAAIVQLRAAAWRLNRAVLWNNLAILLADQGDLPSARGAARRALQLAESAEPDWLPTVRATLLELGH